MTSTDSPWSDAELLKTTREFLGAGDDADQPEPVRFVRGVAKLLKKRTPAATDEPALRGAPAVFVLRPMHLLAIEPDKLDFHPMLDDGQTDVEGRIWIVGPVVASGESLPITASDDAEIFRLIRVDLALGELPAAIYNRRAASHEIRFYPNGLSDPDSYQRIRIPGVAIPMDTVFAVVDSVYREHLATPGAQDRRARLWKNARKYWVAEDAESAVQMYLKIALGIAFPTCKINVEPTQVSGRIDIEVEEATRGSVVRHALIELKVLRSYGSTGLPYSDQTTATWIEEGVDQAFTYREERKTLASGLCCFDMRQVVDEACFAAALTKAEQLGVFIRSWRVFASAKLYRRAFVNTALQAVRPTTGPG